MLPLSHNELTWCWKNRLHTCTSYTMVERRYLHKMLKIEEKNVTVKIMRSTTHAGPVNLLYIIMFKIRKIKPSLSLVWQKPKSFCGDWKISDVRAHIEILERILTRCGIQGIIRNVNIISLMFPPKNPTSYDKSFELSIVITPMHMTT